MILLFHPGLFGVITGGFFVVPGVFVLIGLLTVYLGVQSVRDARAARTWPVVQGVVRRVEIRSAVNPAVRRGKRVQYEPYVEYQFPSGATVCTSSQIKLNLISRGQARAQRIIAPYRVGHNVAVHVEPVPAGRSVLQVELTFDDYFVLFCGLVFMTGGLVLIVLGWYLWAHHVK